MTLKVVTEKNFDLEVKSVEGIVMVELGADWCGPCKVLEPVLDQVAAVGTFKVVKVDVDDSPEIAKEFGVRGVPTVLVFKNGQVVARSVGVKTKSELLKLAEV